MDSNIQMQSFQSMASAYPSLLEELPLRLLDGKDTICWINKERVKFWSTGEDPMLIYCSVPNGNFNSSSEEFYPTHDIASNISRLRDIYLKPILQDLEDFLGESEAISVG